MTRCKYEYRISISKRENGYGNLKQITYVDFDTIFTKQLLVNYKGKKKISTLTKFGRGIVKILREII